jgi:hypothetical protein
LLSAPPERVAALLKTVRDGLSNKAQIVAYHGTSIETVKNLLRTGYLPPDIRATKKGFFVAPIVTTKDSNGRTVRRFSDKAAIKTTGVFARSAARGAEFFRLLDLDHDSILKIKAEFDNLWPITLADEDAISSFAHNLNMPIENVANALRSSRDHAGVTLALNKRIFEDFKTEADGQNGIFVEVTSGLSLDYIVGIQPLGEEEWEFIEALEAAMKNKLK